MTRRKTARSKARAQTLAAKQARWSRRIGQWRDSGLSQRIFCKREGLALSTFQWWRQRLAGVAGAAQPPTFLPIEPTPPAAATGAAGVVHVELADGVRVRLEGEAAWHAIAALVRRLA
jgi:hypothetical protein